MKHLPKICPVCNNLFNKNPDSSIKQWEKQVTCSKSCENIRRTGLLCPQPIKRSLENRFWDKVKKHPGCWEWTGATSDAGYGVLGKGRRGTGLIRASHVSWTIHHNLPVPKGMIVRHTCDNPPCCNPEHLLVGTYKQNHEDMIKRGREVFKLTPKYGKENARGKLTDKDVREIILKHQQLPLPPRRYGRIAMKKRLADEYNISLTHLKDIVNRKVRKSA